jgi:hypothetical protein
LLFSVTNQSALWEEPDDSVLDEEFIEEENKEEETLLIKLDNEEESEHSSCPQLDKNNKTINKDNLIFFILKPSLFYNNKN